MQIIGDPYATYGVLQLRLYVLNGKCTEQQAK